MRLRDSKRSAQEIAREMIRLRDELLNECQTDGDEEIVVREGGDRFTIRILWRNCVLIASDTQQRRQALTNGSACRKTLSV
jgi:hypothetical protein